MNLETNGIPDVKIEQIGNKNHPVFMVTGLIKLPCWNGYYLFDNSYKLKEYKVVTEGRIKLWIDHAIAPDGTFYLPPEQVKAYHDLSEYQDKIKSLIIEKLKLKFPQLLSEEYASWDHTDPDFPNLSDLTTGFDFKNYIGPESIHIGEDVKDEQAYVTWRFRCRWDPEHGLDVITHKDRIIDIGPEGDIWKIYQDNGTYDQVQEELKNKVWKKPVKKKWWRFW